MEEKKNLIKVPKREIPGFDIRYTTMADGDDMEEWFEDPETLRWYPLNPGPEVQDAVQRWVGFSHLNASLTGTMNGEPCVIATLYLQPYKKLMHQCQMGIISSPKYRRQGIGTQMMRNLIYLAKEKFDIEILHLEVCEGNPAIKLYEKFGFKEFGIQRNRLKLEDGSYIAHVFMELNLDEIEL